jgi:hypothetical protein
MKDCVILINDRLVSLSHTTHSSSLNTQLLLSLVHVYVSDTVEKVCFVCMIPPTEHLIVLVHDVFERGLVHVFVNRYRYHVNEGVWVKINF